MRRKMEEMEKEEIEEIDIKNLESASQKACEIKFTPDFTYALRESIFLLFSHLSRANKINHLALILVSILAKRYEIFYCYFIVIITNIRGTHKLKINRDTKIVIKNCASNVLFVQLYS